MQLPTRVFFPLLKLSCHLFTFSGTYITPIHSPNEKMFAVRCATLRLAPGKRWGWGSFEKRLRGRRGAFAPE